MAKKKRHKKKSKAQVKSLKEVFLNWWKIKHPILAYIFLFFGLTISFFVFINLDFFKSGFHIKITNGYAFISSFVLNILGYQTNAYQAIIKSNSFSVDIKKGCDAIEPTVLFLASILAFPTKISKKLIGIVVGTVLLGILNIFRIVSLYFTGIHYPKIFDFLHIEVWQIVFIFLSMALCFIWIKWAIQASKPVNNLL